MIKIYDINDNVLIHAELTSAAVREEELSKSDYIQLSFSIAEKLILPVGAYIEHTYKIDKVREVTEKFLLLEAYEPTQTSESSWKYTPNFQHPKMILSKTPFYILTKNSKNEQIKQSVWSFVGTTSSLCEKIADFLNKDIKFGKCGWVCNMVGVTANTVNVSFSDNDFISALSAICNAIGDNCEWHIDYDNEQVYIGKVVIGSEPILLEVGKNIGSPSINSSKESYYNSFSVFGGSRNITQTNEKGENISSGDIRLQLSAGSGSILIDGKQQTFTIDEFSTIDLRKDKTKEPLFTKILDFSDIFPSLNTYAYNVRGRVKYVLDKNNKKIPLTYNSDGSVKEYKTFTVWYMRLAYPTTEKVSGKTLINTTVDDGITHYWYDFEITDDLLINGKNIGCSFEANFNDGALSTPLAGRGTNGDYVGFELTYHDKDDYLNATDDTKKWVRGFLGIGGHYEYSTYDVAKEGFQVRKGDYEIIYQEDNDIIIPSNADSMLIPRGEDKPSLKCNITILYNIAMKESVYEEDAQNRLLEAAKKEIIRLLSDLNNYSFKSYPQIFAAENPCLQIGQNVTYKDGNGYTLESRVLKLTTNIDYDFVQEITIGNQTIKGTTTQLREDVQKIIASGGSNGGGSYTAAQMNNLVAKYGTNHFLSKRFDDTAQGSITFEKLQKMLQGLQLGSGGHGLDGNGNAQLADVILDRLHDPKSTPQERVIIGAQGFDMYMDENGKSHLYIDNLAVRNKLFASAMEIRQVSYAGGTTIFSNAGSTIAKVAHIFDAKGEKVIAYKCYAKADDGTTATANWWKPGMMGLCQTFNIKAGVYEGVQNRYYWRLCIGAGQEYLDDGKLYDYFTLSNLESFAGQDGVQPDSEPHILANELGELLQFDGVLVSIVSNNEYTSFADILAADGITKDDGGSDVKARRFFGYDPESNAAPAVGDVVVNVGDQVRWNQYGNVIKLSTSTEDDASNVAPAISMYHGIGAPRRISASQEGTSVWQWKELTSIVSPLDVMYNAKNFRFVTYTDEGDMIDVGSVYDAYELRGSYGCAVRATDGTYTPALDGIAFSLTHRLGNYVETVSDFTLQGTIDGKSYVLANKKLSDLSDHLADAKMVKLEAIVGDEVKATIDYPVMEDGAKGDPGESIKGDPGDDAVNIIVNPAVITYITDEDGVLTNTANKFATISATKGGKSVRVSFVGDPACTNCSAEYPSASSAVVKITSLKYTDVMSADGKTSKSMPHTSGCVKCAINVEGDSFLVTIPFQVSMNAFMGRVYWNNKELSADFTNLKSDLEKDSPDILKAFGGSLKVSAAENMFSNYEGMVDENGKIIKTGESGLVTSANMADMFSKKVDADGNMKAVASVKTRIITTDGSEGTTSVGEVNIEADKINLAGHTMAFTGKQITIDTDNFKLDASGNVSMTGKINATSGNIGVFMISPDGYKDSLMSGTWEDDKNPDVSRFTTRMQLSKNLFEMIYKSDPNLGDVVANSKFCRVSVSMGTNTDGLLNPVYIKANSSLSQTAAIVIDSEGGLNPSYAIYARSGTFAGLRLNWQISPYNYNITKYDHFILNTATNENTVYTLPSPADSVGQVIIISNKYGYSCTIKGELYGKGYASSVKLNGYDEYVLISDGYHWIYRWFNW